MSDDAFDLTLDLSAKPEQPKKPRKLRRALDAYGTVDDLALAIVTRAAMWRPMPEAILEPTAGDGPFVRACRSVFGVGMPIGAVDIDGSKRAACLSAGANSFMESDILRVDPAILARFDLIIGNPPFNDAAAIIDYLGKAAPHALKFFLLPVSFFGGTTGTKVKGRPVMPRNAEFKRRNRIIYFAEITPRPSFTGDGRTDRMEYGVFGFGDAAIFDGPKLDDAITWERTKPEPDADPIEVPPVDASSPSSFFFDEG